MMSKHYSRAHACTLLFLLIMLVICGMGCGGGANQGVGFGGVVFLGGEPASALPVPGVPSFTPFFSARKGASVNRNNQTRPTSLIVSCDPGISEPLQRESLKQLGFEIIRQLRSDSNTYVVKPKNTSDFELSYRNSLGAGFVKAVEYNFPLMATATTPNDTYYQTRQWDMMVTKFNVAWDDYKGRDPVVVAVLDTGINVDSSELNGRMAPEADWYDFIDNDSDPREPIYTAGAGTYSHGTNVTGIIGSIPGNSLGYVGAAWDKNAIKILPIRVLDTKGSGGIDGLIDGLRWAVDHNAKVVNMSLGADHSANSDLFNQAVAYARDHNVTIVCAAGNENTAVNYPARLAKIYPNIIAVGATGYTNQKAYYSCYGEELTVMAPGGDPLVGSSLTQQNIWNITYDKQNQTEVYDIGFCGTSQATPHVSALAAMLYSYGASTAAQVRDIIKHTATDLGALGRDDLYGYGLINAYAAMLGEITDITLVTVGLRDPSTKQDVTAKIHPNGRGEFQFPPITPGKYELYGAYDLPNGYKYEGMVPVTITSSKIFLIPQTSELSLQLLPD